MELYEESRIKRIKCLCIKYFPEEVNCFNNNYETLLYRLSKIIDNNEIISDRLIKTFSKEGEFLFNSYFSDLDLHSSKTEDVNVHTIFDAFIKKSPDNDYPDYMTKILNDLNKPTELRKVTYETLANSKFICTELILSYIIIYIEKYSSLTVSNLVFYIGSLLADIFYSLFYSFIEDDIEFDFDLRNYLIDITGCNDNLVNFTLKICSHFLFICEHKKVDAQLIRKKRKINISDNIPEYIFNEIDMVNLDKVDNIVVKRMKEILHCNSNFYIKMILWLCIGLRKNFTVNKVDLVSINCFFKNVKTRNIEEMLRYFSIFFELFQDFHVDI